MGVDLTKDNLFNTIIVVIFGIVMGICVVGSIWVLKNKQYINPKPIETIEERREWDVQEPIVYHPRNESSYMPIDDDSEPVDMPMSNDEYQPIKNIKNFD